MSPETDGCQQQQQQQQQSIIKFTHIHFHSQVSVTMCTAKCWARTARQKTFLAPLPTRQSPKQATFQSSLKGQAGFQLFFLFPCDQQPGFGGKA